MDSPDPTAAIGRRLSAIRDRIAAAAKRAGRSPYAIQLIAVTKTRSAQEIAALLSLGVTELAENRVQELRRRHEETPKGARWHLIGHLQTNKAKYLPGVAACVHSADSSEVITALARAMERHPHGPPLEVFLQVNIAREEQKFGCEPSEAAPLLKALAVQRRLKCLGLMAMAPFGDNPEEARPHFRALRDLRDQLQTETGIPLPELSMGMSGDYEVAIEEGATMVRIGTALFED